ncbi:MAG: SDR family NAD(P)-dependent oxidoreductase [Acidimicrobiaceae bacterium]|nr:SDR family NAD(P)-dependent oxidoreductase [Acidimicrobiaceae bacterium]
MFDLSGRTALVTGAGKNIGAGIARGLAGQGAHVVVNDYFADRAQATTDEIVAAGGSAVASVFDVTGLEAVVAAVAGIGVVDILVNNAGLAGPTDMKAEKFRDMDPSEWTNAVDVNLYGVMNCCHAVVDSMCERGWGRVITISSAAGTHGVSIGVAPYSAGKGGGLAFTRSLALEVARFGVTANTLALGLFERKNREITEHFARAVPAGRTGRPEDVAAACVWLASDEAAWVTAQTIGINGGSLTS